MIKYHVDIYNEFDSLISTREFFAENVIVTDSDYTFVKYDEVSGKDRVVAVIDRDASRAIDIIEAPQ